MIVGDEVVHEAEAEVLEVVEERLEEEVDSAVVGEEHHEVGAASVVVVEEEHPGAVDSRLEVEDTEEFILRQDMLWIFGYIWRLVFSWQGIMS